MEVKQPENWKEIIALKIIINGLETNMANMGIPLRDAEEVRFLGSFYFQLEQNLQLLMEAKQQSQGMISHKTWLMD